MADSRIGMKGDVVGMRGQYDGHAPDGTHIVVTPGPGDIPSVDIPGLTPTDSAVCSGGDDRTIN